MRKSLKELVVEYGAVALVIYLTTTCLVYAGVWFAIQLGWKPTGVIGGAGLWVGAWMLTKVTQPFRIAATIAITPFVARLYERMTRRNRKGPDTPSGNTPVRDSAAHGDEGPVMPRDTADPSRSLR